MRYDQILGNYVSEGETEIQHVLEKAKVQLSLIYMIRMKGSVNESHVEEINKFEDI